MKKYKIKKIIFGLISLTLLLIMNFGFNKFTYAADSKQEITDDQELINLAKGIYDTSDADNAGEIGKRGGNFIWVATAVGIVTGVGVIASLGVKFIFSAPEGKAEIKKQAFMYMFGAFLIVSASLFVGVIADVAYTTLNI